MTSVAASKEDFIFRDMGDAGSEIVSKDGNGETATKKRNEDFFKELDKDRIARNCEYAALVSLLEPEGELYNMGFVDVSHRFPKCT